MSDENQAASADLEQVTRDWYSSLHLPRPLLVVISGPSGVGKDATIQLMKERGYSCHFVVTATTRPRRPTEIDGVDYHFRHKAACRCTGSRRHCLAGCGRTRLHHGSGFLCMEKAAFQPCHLASVRPVREHLPFFRCYFLCPSLKVIAACKHY